MASPGYSMVAKLELVRAVCGLKLPLYELKVLVMLASLINDKTGCAYPSHSSLAGLLNIHERHVGRALKGLQQRGLVSVAVPGTRRRAAEYRIDPKAVQTASGTSTGATVPPLQVGQSHLYRRDSGTSTGGSEPPLEAVQGQLRASEAQAKQQPKLSRARSARPRSLEARAPAAAPRPKRNAWVEKYRHKPEPAARPEQEAAD